MEKFSQYKKKIIKEFEELNFDAFTEFKSIKQRLSYERKSTSIYSLLCSYSENFEIYIDFRCECKKNNLQEYKCIIREFIYTDRCDIIETLQNIVMPLDDFEEIVLIINHFIGNYRTDFNGGYDD